MHTQVHIVTSTCPAGNTVINASYAPVLVTSAHDVIIGNNTIRDCLCESPSYGQGFKCAATLPFACPRVLQVHAG